MPDWLTSLLTVLAFGAGVGISTSWFIARQKRKHFENYAVLFLTGALGRRLLDNIITQQLCSPANQDLTYRLIDLWASTVHGQEILAGAVTEGSTHGQADA
jgi:hypothetical protein